MTNRPRAAEWRWKNERQKDKRWQTDRRSTLTVAMAHVEVSSSPNSSRNRDHTIAMEKAWVAFVPGFLWSPEGGDLVDTHLSRMGETQKKEGSEKIIPLRKENPVWPSLSFENHRPTGRPASPAPGWLMSSKLMSPPPSPRVSAASPEKAPWWPFSNGVGGSGSWSAACPLSGGSRASCTGGGNHCGAKWGISK